MVTEKMYDKLAELLVKKGANVQKGQPVVINAYAKFAGDNSAMERAAKAREKSGALRKLLTEIEK